MVKNFFKKIYDALFPIKSMNYSITILEKDLENLQEMEYADLDYEVNLSEAKVDYENSIDAYYRIHDKNYVNTLKICAVLFVVYSAYCGAFSLFYESSSFHLGLLVFSILAVVYAAFAMFVLLDGYRSNQDLFEVYEDFDGFRYYILAEMNNDVVSAIVTRINTASRLMCNSVICFVVSLILSIF